MSVFQTFYLKFSSNAEDVIKGNRSVEKSTKDTERSLKTTNDTTKEIGQNFVKVAEGIATAIGAFGGLEILKNGVQTAIDYNTQLRTMAAQAGLTAEQLRKVAIATHAAGGTEEEGKQAALMVAKIQLRQGKAGLDPFIWLGNIRQELSTLPQSMQLNKLYGEGGLGLPPGVGKYLTSGSKGDYDDAGFKKLFKDAAKASEGTNEAADAAQAVNEKQVLFGEEQKNFFNKLLDNVSPNVQKIYEYLTGKVSNTGPIAGSIAIIAEKTAELAVPAYIAGKAAKYALARKAAGTAAKTAAGDIAEGAAGDMAFNLGGASFAAAGAAGLGTMAAVGASALAVGTAAGYGIVSLFQKQIEAILVKHMTSDLKPMPLAKSFHASVHKKESSLDPTTEWQNAVNDPAHKAAVEESGLEWDKINSRKIMGHIATAKSVISAASSITPPSRGDTTVNIQKIEVHTQATDSTGIATGISGALKEEIYTALGFLASQSDNGIAK